SSAVRVAGLAVREASRRTSSWRGERTLAEELRGADVVGIEGIDTRRLTIAIRSSGAMRGAISTEDLDPASLAERARGSAGMEGADLAASVSVAEPFRADELVGPADGNAGRILRVAAYDFGMKRNILRRLAATGCDATVFPAATPAAEVLAGGFDGVFLSNGPGDPAATSYGVRVVEELLDGVPVFGICLGHQLLAQALGGRTYKMRFGHRGANQPVKDLDTGRVEVTSHNHGFAVDPGSWGASEDAVAQDAPPVVETPGGRLALTHWNLNDGTLEGLRCLDVPAFSVQYHPEAAPGPHDSRYLFESFRELMDAPA
ncbi:MAG: glutamine-hydrolyzing carbamoyl-phosphate synthase small subunit, partial [Actinomycetota bacterium]|nr:glutamine-hydrolyzing carbamoyl-phosphate synthase small subunit [Actinomycetota bacterium]